MRKVWAFIQNPGAGAGGVVQIKSADVHPTTSGADLYVIMATLGGVGCFPYRLVCQLVLPGVHTGLGFREEIVHIVCSETAGKHILWVKSGQLSRYSTALLGVPPMPMLVMLRMKSF